MRFLDEQEYRKEAEPILRQLFVNDDRYGAIFALPDLDFELQIHNFIQHWQYYNSSGYHTRWILALLTQVCGEQKAWDLLKQHDMKPIGT